MSLVHTSLSIFLVSSVAWAGYGPTLTSYDRSGFPTDKRPAFAAELEQFRAKARQGGLFRIGIMRPMNLVSPYFRKNGVPLDRAAISRDLMYTTLMYMSPSRPPTAAEGFTAHKVWIDYDKQMVKVQVDPRARFWDDSPVTANDIVYSWNEDGEHFGRNLRAYREIYGDVTVTALNHDTVEFHFRSINRMAFHDAVWFLLVSMPIVKRWTAPTHFTVPMPFMGAGPYRMTSLARERATLKKVDRWWGQEHPAMTGLYNFSQIDFRVIRDVFGLRMAFASGEITTYMEDTPNEEQNLLRRAQERGAEMRVLPRKIMWALETLNFNTAREHMQVKGFREALMDLVDFETANRIFYSGRLKRFEPGELSEHYPKGPLSEAARLELERSGLSFDADALSEGPLPQLQSPYDRIRRASQRLKDLGYTRGKNGLEFNGKPVRLTVLLMNHENHVRSVRLLEINLKRLGIEVEAREFSDQASYSRMINKFDYDLVLSAISIPVDFEMLPMNLLQQRFHSAFAQATPPSNTSRLRSPLVDWALAQLVEVRPIEPRFAVLSEILLRALRAERAFITMGDKFERSVFVPRHLCTPMFADDLVTMSYFGGDCPIYSGHRALRGQW